LVIKKYEEELSKYSFKTDKINKIAKILCDNAKELIGGNFSRQKELIKAFVHSFVIDKKNKIARFNFYKIPQLQYSDMLFEGAIDAPLANGGGGSRTKDTSFCNCGIL